MGATKTTKATAKRGKADEEIDEDKTGTSEVDPPWEIPDAGEPHAVTSIGVEQLVQLEVFDRSLKYNSVRYSCTLSMPHQPTRKAHRIAREWAKAECEDFINSSINELAESLSSSSPTKLGGRR